MWYGHGDRSVASCGVWFHRIRTVAVFDWHGIANREPDNWNDSTVSAVLMVCSFFASFIYSPVMWGAKLG